MQEGREGAATTRALHNSLAFLQESAERAFLSLLLLLFVEDGRAGASGLVGKHLEFEVLVHAIHAVAAGEIWANRRATCLALEILTGRSGRVAKADLTKREQEIADACGQGLRNKEIASRLNISPKTVKGHLNNIFRKLHVESRFALALQERTQPKS